MICLVFLALRNSEQVLCLSFNRTSDEREELRGERRECVRMSERRKEEECILCFRSLSRFVMASMREFEDGHYIILCIFTILCFKNQERNEKNEALLFLLLWAGGETKQHRLSPFIIVFFFFGVSVCGTTWDVWVCKRDGPSSVPRALAIVRTRTVVFFFGNDGHGRQKKWKMDDKTTSLHLEHIVLWWWLEKNKIQSNEWFMKLRGEERKERRTTLRGTWLRASSEHLSSH